MVDIRAAIRSLSKSPGFSAVAILTIAVGIGANTALFSVYDRLVLHPVTIPDPSSLVAIQSSNAQLNLQVPAISWPRYEEIRSQTRSFSALGISAFDNFALTGNGEPEQLNSLRVSASFLPTLGVTPSLGRNFTADEDVPNGPAVCIISQPLWQTRFGGRRTIVGETITLNGQPWEVVGVMPPALSVPFGQVQVFAPRVFEVGGLTAAQVQAGSGYAQAIARVNPGVSMAQVTSELAAVSAVSKERFSTRLDANNTSEPILFVAQLVGGLEPTFYTLLAAVAFVMLIACANVASLFLGRLTQRHKEIAVRQSLGATRAQVVRQFLVESLVFCAAAGALGVLLGIWALDAVSSLVASQLPPNTTLTMNWRAAGFAGAATLISALLVGIVPAVHASGAQLVDALKESARGSSGGERSSRFRSALIVAEVTLSVVLLIGSGLLLASFLKLQRIPPGFEARGAATAFVGLPAIRYKTPVQQADFFDAVVARLRVEAGVTAAAAAIGVPLSGFNPRSPYSVGGRPVLPLPQRPLANLSIVTPDYFSTLRIHFAAGRAFTSADREGAPGVCIVSESLARRLFPGESALGKVLLRGRDAEVRAEIVGIARDVKSNGLNAAAPDEIYYPMRQLPRPGLAFVARSDGDPAALQQVIRSAVASVDRDQPISFFATLDTNIANSLGVQRIVASLTTVFAMLALALSAVGLYSVLAYAVTQRTPEIGIRMALGAQRGQVIGLVMGSGLKLVAIGLLAGLLGSAGLARLIRSLLFAVEPIDPIIYAGVAMLFGVVAAAACLAPSWKASRIDPLDALRGD